MTRGNMSRCPIHETVLNAAGKCLPCEHPELDDGMTADDAQRVLDSIPDRPLTRDEMDNVERTMESVRERAAVLDDIAAMRTALEQIQGLAAYGKCDVCVTIEGLATEALAKEATRTAKFSR